MSDLNNFQREVLDAFFRHEQRFFLTGGAALIGFYPRFQKEAPAPSRVFCFG
jgi:hypothetical protein